MKTEEGINKLEEEVNKLNSKSRKTEDESKRLTALEGLLDYYKQNETKEDVSE